MYVPLKYPIFISSAAVGTVATSDKYSEDTIKRCFSNSNYVINSMAYRNTASGIEDSCFLC
jgi:hypothetical protein